MVGVAGKSKGCNTCRRRKVKCDETRPRCLRCLKSNIPCDGYDRYPVFIDRTAAGFRKRQPLEEVKGSDPTALVSFPSPDAEAARLIDWFWPSFARTPPSRFALLSPSHWLDYILPSYSASPLLQIPLLAVSTTRLGLSSNRHDVVREGRRLYSQSLTMTRNALENSETTDKDYLMATVSILIIYELMDASNGNLQGWLGHLSGLARLIECRGPIMHDSPADRALFEHSRYVLMLQHLLARKRSVFGQAAWIEEPWRGCEKSVEQRVFDQGLRLTEAFERCDAAADLGMAEAMNVFLTCMDMHDILQQLMDEYLTPAASISNPLPVSPLTPSSNTNPAVLLLTLTALGIQLGACDSAYGILSRAIEPHITAWDINNPPSESLRAITEEKRHRLSHRRCLAQRILRYSTLCLNLPLGAMGGVRIIFSLKIAMQQFHPRDPEFAECQDVIKVLLGKSARFSSLLPSNPSMTGRDITDREGKLVKHEIKCN